MTNRLIAAAAALAGGVLAAYGLRCLNRAITRAVSL